MKWCRDLYWGDSIASDKKPNTRKRKILYRLKHNKLQINVYVIVLPLGNDGILEIYPSYVLLQEIYKRQPVCVIGLAADRNEAYELTGKIILDCYAQSGSFDVKSFVRERQGDNI